MCQILRAAPHRASWGRRGNPLNREYGRCAYEPRLRTCTHPTQIFAAGASLAAHTQPALWTGFMAPAWRSLHVSRGKIPDFDLSTACSPHPARYADWPPWPLLGASSVFSFSRRAIPYLTLGPVSSSPFPCTALLSLCCGSRFFSGRLAGWCTGHIAEEQEEPGTRTANKHREYPPSYALNLPVK